MKIKIYLSFVFISLLFAFLFGSICKAQLVHQEWVTRYVKQHGTSDLFTPLLALDKNGNSYIAGEEMTPTDTIQILVVKYNNSGVQQWVSHYRYLGWGFFLPTGLVIDTLGNAYVTSDFGPNSLDDSRILIVKFSTINGNVLWAKTCLGNYDGSQPYNINIDKQNNIYVVGWFDSSSLCIKYNANGDTLWSRKWHPPGDYGFFYNCTIDDSLNVIATGTRAHWMYGGAYDTLLTIKYTSNGDMRWIKTYYNPTNMLNNIGRYITSDHNGNIYVGGETRNSQGYYEYITLKYNNNGVPQWLSFYHHNMDDFLRGIAIDKIHNKLYATGYSWGIGAFTDYATLGYNALTGDSIWVKRYTGINYNNFNRSPNIISTDTLGNVYITGSINTGSSMDIVTIKYSPQGNQLWVEIYNGPSNVADWGNGLELDNLNNVYVAGKSGYDYVLIKYSQPQGIKKISNEIPTTFILNQNYPNPFNPSTIINYQIPKSSNVTLKVYDLLGRETAVLVKEKQDPGTYEVEWDGTKFASGLYFYRIEAENFVNVKKMVLIK